MDVKNPAPILGRAYPAPGPIALIPSKIEIAQARIALLEQANARLLADRAALLEMLREIANDPEVNLVDSERRIRVYHLLESMGAL